MQYPWAVSIGRPGACGICGEDVAGQKIVACLKGRNWAHELCGLREYAMDMSAAATPLIEATEAHSGTQRQLIAAIHANAVVGVPYDYAKDGKHHRYHWTERKQ
jgi:hypothetical protein